MPDAGLTRSLALQDVAGILASAEDLEGLVRPLLQLITSMTDYEVAYLSVHDRANDHQLWRFVHVDAGVGPPEGQSWPWTEVLCHYVAERGRHTIRDLAEEIPGHPSNRFLGVRGFISVPYSLVGRQGEVAGTLCATSSEPLEGGDEILQVFELLAHLAADRFGREIELGHERIRADLAERQMVERTIFLAQAEHALKSPLQIVRGWSETLDDRYHALDDGQRLEGIRRIRSHADRLVEQVNALLAEGQTTILGHELRPVPLDLVTHLTELVAEYDGSTSDLAIVAGDLGGVVVVDPRALDQIVGHLLENAIKYAVGGTATVSTAVAPEAVVVRIEDDGPGFSEDVDVFQPFVRGDGVEGTVGAGLGMHIVRRLAEASGGSVRAVSPATGGAAFEVTLPSP